MKKYFAVPSLLILFIVGLTASPCEILAQENDEDPSKASITVTVGAEVTSSIEMITLRNIQFGKVQTSQQILRIHPITDNQTGKMKILGQSNGAVRINYQENQKLQKLEGDYSVDFRYRLAGNAVDNQSTADLIDFDNFEAELNQDGEYYIWVGGQADISELQPGDYQGDFTIEVEYM